MNTRVIMKITIAVILMVTVSLSIPSTLAKYTDKKSYQIVVSSEMSNTAYKNKATKLGTDTPASISYTVEKSGYYAIIARGGDGSTGMYETQKQNPNSYGGKGGYAYACVYLNKGETVTAYIGNKATEPKYASKYSLTTLDYKKAARGIGGSNGKFASGGNGSYLNNGTTSTVRNTSAAGGAATCVVTDKVLVIGAGGGGGASGDTCVTKALARQGGHGGAGGSIVSNDGSSNDSSYTVYYGFAGTGEDWRMGRGGTIDGGIRGKSGNGDGNDGTKISGLSGGNGGAADFLGGGGGGGYAGGGGGAGDGNLANAGGGGGGSSAVIRSNNGKSSLKLNSTALEKIFELAGYSSDFSSYTGGFAIIAYLNDGVNTSLYSAGSF